MSAPETRTSPVVLIIAWLIVGIPGAWGVEQTLFKSLDLFRAQVKTPASPNPPATAPARSAKG